MHQIKKYEVVKDKLYKDLWVIVNCDDLCNCELLSVNHEGECLPCFDENCPNNDIEKYEFLLK